jgi:hypothetical protein
MLDHVLAYQRTGTLLNGTSRRRLEYWLVMDTRLIAWERLCRRAHCPPWGNEVEHNSSLNDERGF